MNNIKKEEEEVIYIFTYKSKIEFSYGNLVKKKLGFCSNFIKP